MARFAEIQDDPSPVRDTIASYYRFLCEVLDVSDFYTRSRIVLSWVDNRVLMSTMPSRGAPPLSPLLNENSIG
eukprot:scaffold91636_cov36-Cyclotella_meneghiniana.AAC.1